VQQILAQDLQILSVIEQAKSNIIKDLRQVQSAKKAVGAYKSGDAPNRLDEKGLNFDVEFASDSQKFVVLRSSYLSVSFHFGIRVA